jgi:hypothetical protein
MRTPGSHRRWAAAAARVPARRGDPRDGEAASETKQSEVQDDSDPVRNRLPFVLGFSIRTGPVKAQLCPTKAHVWPFHSPSSPLARAAQRENPS